MDQIFQRIMDSNLSELPGTTVHAIVPLPESLVNEVLAAVLHGSRAIDSVQVSIQPENRVTLAVRTAVLPWPISLKLKMDTSVDLDSYSSPKMRVWLESNRLLGSLGSLLNLLPDGIRLYGNQGVIDLGAFLAPAQRRWLSLLKSAGIRTQPGRLIVDAQIQVP